MEHSGCAEFVADCHVRVGADLLAHTWDPVVLSALADGPKRRIDLRRSIGGVSDKPLTEALRRLLDGHLIDRRAFPAAPPHIEYSLTDLGRSFVDGPLRALGHWAEQHGHELLPDDDDNDLAC